MFAESPWSRKTIGDVDVVYHDGLYHLFHLVLPNHDFIAHAISDNAINWRRVDNALFIGDPGSWDDLMLWTMHVTPDPHQPGKWRMFYTGLSRRDQGLKQRIGMAVSDDLYRWKKAPVNWTDRRGRKDPELVKEARARLQNGTSTRIKATFDEESCFPLTPDPEFYEASLGGERNWISFRDPFYYRDGDRGWLLVAGRSNDGPLVRRGCVAALEETSENQFVAMPPLHSPQVYDDIEVPNLFKINGEYYLIGSIREDAKIRYWHTDKIGKPWRNYFDNVLLAKGNYAGRICHDPKGILLWNFYTKNLNNRTTNNLMPPPKRLDRRDDGRLIVKSFEGLEERVLEEIDTRCVSQLKTKGREEFCRTDSQSLHLSSPAGFQAFVFDQELSCFRMRATLKMVGSGKCGLLYRIDPETHDGYYISLDLMKGVAQFRSWGTGPARTGEHMMQFESLQSGNWYHDDPQNVSVQLISFGSYHELSINGAVTLSLADDRFHAGKLGIYIETAELRIDDLVVERLESPTQSDDHLTQG